MKTIRQSLFFFTFSVLILGSSYSFALSMSDIDLTVREEILDYFYTEKSIEITFEDVSQLSFTEAAGDSCDLAVSALAQYYFDGLWRQKNCRVCFLLEKNNQGPASLHTQTTSCE